MAENLVLHTYSKYIQSEADDLIRNLDQFTHSNNKIMDTLMNQKERLEELEKNFYKEVTGINCKNYSDFIINLKKMIPEEDLKKLQFFSNRTSADNLFKKFKLLYKDSSVAPEINGEYWSAQQIIELSKKNSTPITIKVDKRLKTKSALKKELQGKNILNLSNNFGFKNSNFKRGDKIIEAIEISIGEKIQKMSLKEFYNLEEFIDLVVEPLLKECNEEIALINKDLSLNNNLTKKNSSPINKLSRVQLVDVLWRSKDIQRFFSQVLSSSLEEEQINKELFMWTIGQRAQSLMFQNHRTINDKTMDQERVDRLFNFVTSSLGITKGDLYNALKQVWINNEEKLKEELKISSMEGFSKVPGAFGEILALVVIEYINLHFKKQPTLKNYLKSEWTGNERDEIFNELKRSDVNIITELGNLYGIQSKNYSENNDTIQTNLHPMQVIENLAINSIVLSNEDIASLENLFVNMAFNEDIKTQYLHSLQSILGIEAISLNNFATIKDLENSSKDKFSFYLIGTIIVPGSIVLESYIESLNNKLPPVTITFGSIKSKTDEEFENHHYYNYYWNYNKRINQMLPTTKNKMEYERLLNSKQISVHLENSIKKMLQKVRSSLNNIK